MSKKELSERAQNLRSCQERSGLPLKRFFNTSGQKYLESKLKDKL